MVTEEEQDAALAAILDSNIGIGPNGWDPKLERRCAPSFLESTFFVHSTSTLSTAMEPTGGSNESVSMRAAQASCCRVHRLQRLRPKLERQSASGFPPHSGHNVAASHQ